MCTRAAAVLVKRNLIEIALRILPLDRQVSRVLLIILLLLLLLLPLHVIQAVLLLEHLVDIVATGDGQAALLVVQKRGDELPVRLVHLRMLQILRDGHPLESRNLPFAPLEVQIEGLQRNDHIKIGAAEGAAVRMPQTDHRPELGPDSRLLVHLPDRRIDEILPRLHIAAGQLPAVGYHRIPIGHHQNLVLIVDHQPADAHQCVREVGQVVGLVLRQPAVHGHHASSCMMEVETVLRQNGHPVGLLLVHTEPNRPVLVRCPKVQGFWKSRSKWIGKLKLNIIFG